ncbi:MAG: hypothetical protein KDC38_07195, partial [Planctomycetes bacterium]|nr:hypothetical protein [Planctomycetota bacterium]
MSQHFEGEVGHGAGGWSRWNQSSTGGGLATGSLIAFATCPEDDYAGDGNRSREREVRSMRMVLWLLAGIVVFGALGYSAFRTFRSTPAERVEVRSDGGWKVVDGAAEVSGAWWIAKDGARLEIEGRTVRSLGDARFTAEGLPEVSDGIIEIAVADDWDSGEAMVEAGTTLRVTPDSVVVVVGSVTIEGAERFGARVTLVRTAAGLRNPVVSDRTIDAREWTGQVIDARTGEGLAGVPIRVVFSHSPDGYPPAPFAEHRLDIQSEAGGLFRIPTQHPEDPRLRAHLQVMDPRFAPFVRVTEPQGMDGRWPRTTIALRPAHTVPFYFFDIDQTPLTEMAIAVQEYADPYLAADRPTGEAAEAERYAVEYGAASKQVVFYTDDEGVVPLSREWVRRLDLLHPDYVELNEEDPEPIWKSRMELAFVSLEPYLRPSIRVVKVAPVVSRYVLTDRNGSPLDAMEIEVEVPEEGRWFRLFTDAEGGFGFGVDERLRDQEPTKNEPIQFQLTSRSPRLWRHTMSLVNPAPEAIYAFDVREATTLRLRCVRRDEEGRVVGIEPEQLAIGLDVTPVFRDPSGEVAYRGSVPDGGEHIWLEIRGYLPLELALPTNIRGDAEVDLGEVEFGRGTSVELRVEGLPREAYPRARLTVSSAFIDGQVFEYRLRDDGSVRVEGLLEGHRYLLVVDGENVPRLIDEMWVRSDVIEGGHTIALREEWTPDRDLFVAGRIAGLDTGSTNDYRVVERFYYGDPRDPVILASYPLAPDGAFGSWRVMPRPAQVEVLVLGRGSGFAHVSPRVLSHGAGSFQAGPLAITRTRTGVFTFVYEGIGWTRPPADVRLVAEVDRNHEVARLERHEDQIRLLVSHLLPGRYSLQWEEADGERGSHSFEVENSTFELQETVLRVPVGEVPVLFAATDSRGVPVAGAAVAARPAENVVEVLDPDS